jgi:hypothetical protein
MVALPVRGWLPGRGAPGGGGHDGAPGHVEHPRDVVVAEVVVIAEDQDLALGGRQFGQSADDRPLQLEAGNRGLGVVTPVLGFDEKRVLSVVETLIQTM